MTLEFNSTAMSDVYFNGTRMESVVFNGTTTHNAKNGAVTSAANDDVMVASDSLVFSPGEEDVNRHFVVVQSQFSSGALSDRPVPQLGGVSMSTVFNRTNYFYDDGHSVRISVLKVPTGTSDITLTNCNGCVSVFRVVGIADMTTPYATAYTEGGSGVSVNTATHGCTFLGFVCNFGNVGSVITNTDYVFSPNVKGNASDFQTTGGSITYTATNRTDFLGLAAGVSFSYDFY